MSRRAAILSALAGAVAIVATALVLCPVVYAWTVSTDHWTRVVRIERETADATGTVTVYYYTAGTFPTPTQYANGSYDDTSAGGTFNGRPVNSVQFDASATVAEVYMGSTSALVIPPDGARQLVTYSGSPMSVQGYAGGVPLYLSTSTTIPVSVVGTVPVSQAASVSVDGTLPVAIAGIGAVDWNGVTALAVLGTFGVACVAYGALMRSRDWPRTKVER